MTEYIDREAAIDAITDFAGKAPTRSAYDAIWKSARALRKIPAADVVPVVRCKECKYLVNATVNDNGFLICDISDMEITPDDFCSYGERKDGGADNAV